MFLWKKRFEQSIRLLAKHLSVFWAATNENFDFFLFLFFEKKNTSHTISIYENCMTSVFLEKKPNLKKRNQKLQIVDR